jgi:hypothetical protein
MNQTGSTIQSLNTVPADAYPTCLVIAFDGAADSLRAYFNGQPDATVTTSAVYHDSNHHPAIGNNHWAPGDHQWAPLNGVIDELRIYDRALEASEICQLYSDGAPPSLVGDMNCDGTVDFGDINPFVQCLSNFAAWQATFCCPARNGDINIDGTYGQGSLGDINPFVELLSGGG